ncbi:MAG: SDR family NAD(P)-dependent oxidoreductase [Alphaproteobacteria bacterium]|nr:SDR family NAD(P)-dependent oxidoreductase [Alphaproteobacteria bacterium]
MSEFRAVVFGATGGVGAALVTMLQQSGSFCAIHAGARNPVAAQASTIIPFTFDLADEASIAQAAGAIGSAGPLDLAIVATGMLHGDCQNLPEKGWRFLDAQAMSHVFAVNTIGPALIAKHFLPLLRRDRCSIFAALSARVGSICDNRSGGWHSYRASKAALNMLVRNFAIEFARRNPHGIVVAVHPGTVDTPLTKPFQRSVPEGKLFSPEQSASRILATLDALSPADSGKLFAWNGDEIPF